MTASLNPQRYAIIGLTLATAIIHLLAGFRSPEMFFKVLFILNGVGYVALLAGLYFVPQLTAQRALIRWGLLGYTALTFILYFVFNWPDVWAVMGLITKVIELVLIVLLWLDKTDK